MADYDRFGPYWVHECLGAGGMATVHRATLELEDGTRREVALKRLLPQYADDRRFVEDFVREAKLAAHLHHPNIVRILELGRIGRTYFIAMELVAGHPLMALMRKAHRHKRHAPVGVVIALLTEICDALDHAHTGVDDFGQPVVIVHRDLTPSNMMITDDGHLKVIDFGVAKALTGQLQTSSGMAKGKLGYMSLEAIGGTQLDTRADIFSAGVVMWELLAGKRLFKAKNDFEILAKIREGVVRPPSEHNAECPTELDDIVLRAVARSRDERWPTAAAMRRALDEVRRHYRDRATAREVARWKRSLRASSTLTAKAREESEGEVTAMRLSTGDLEELDEAPEGSQRGDTYEELEYERVRTAPEAGEPPQGEAAFRDDPSETRAAKFKGAVTIVSGSPAFDPES